MRKARSLTLSGLVLAVAVAFAAVACGSRIEQPCGPLPADAGDTDLAPDVSGDLAIDFVVDKDTPSDTLDVRDALDVPDAPDVPDADVDQGPDATFGFGHPCFDNSDCTSGFCVEGLEGAICTEMCTESCPEGYSCRVVLNYYPDLVSLCVPNVLNLCEPCQGDENCLGGTCLKGPDGGFCAADCTLDPCPTTYTCSVVPGTDGGPDLNVCLPVSGSCLCLPGNEGQLRTCQSSNDQGTCRGWEACDAVLGWVDCNARVPAVEECNGIDDDCNALIDDELPESLPCENATEGIGVCKGQALCGGELGWVCNARTPAVETCNFIDDDCNGEVDEGFATLDPDSGQLVYDSFENCGTCGHSCEGSIPFAATIHCAGELGYPVCVVDECQEQYYKLNDFQCILPPDTFCKECATDTDCFGNACLPLAGSHYCFKPCVGDDECFTGYSCLAAEGSAVTYCLPDNGTCDCDANSDNYKKACSITNEIGTCYGFQTCQAGSGWTACDARTPAPETCNGIDDDCNHLQDDALADEGTCQVTVEGVGTCLGTNVCFGSAGWICSAPQPAAEACNYKDDDCDGQTDEGFRDEAGNYGLYDHCGACNHTCDDTVLNGSAACEVSDGVARCVVAACAPGYFPFGDTACVKADATACRPCLEDVDCVVPGDRCEDTPDGGFCAEDCSEGNYHLNPAGQCPEGYTCLDDAAGSHCRPVSGSCTCRAGNEGKSRVCERVNDVGTCYGRESCDPTAGWSTCDAQEPSPEICNVLDDDCNGIADDLPGIGLPCARTVEGVGTCIGTVECQPGSPATSCSAKEPTPEACNYLDDNCDGATDEAFPTLYQSCSVGVGTCLR